MASTVTPATATVQIVESLTLGGVDRGGTHTRTINNVAEADRRVMTISTTGNSVLDLNIANGRGEQTDHSGGDATTILTARPFESDRDDGRIASNAFG